MVNNMKHKVANVLYFLKANVIPEYRWTDLLMFDICGLIS